MSLTTKRSSKDLLHPARVFLRVRHHRSRKGISENAIENDGDVRPRVRVRWDDSTGPFTFISESERSTNSQNLSSSTVVFQRLSKKVTSSCGEVCTETVLTSSFLSNSTPIEIGGTTLCVNSVKRAQQYVLIDSIAEATETELCTSDKIEEDVYVMLAGPDEAEEDVSFPMNYALNDEFDFDELTVSEKTQPALHPIKQVGKRLRDAKDSMHTFFLVPPRRARLDEGEGDANTPSTWPLICEESDSILLDCIHGYEDLVSFVLEGSGAAREDLYCCADHRKDDEYDSNAEDFSGNDYPESECFDNSMSDMDSHSTTQKDSEFGQDYRPSRLRTNYGIFCEPDYIENCLGEGWESDY
ncbi:unnamed protein product [Phytomonas sp. Hart1]|nr:unnamed protein product [Phytomonas sp. Hart1]|eukprot:CCW66128.1 unnamed protein product [Phytomonas sp. isolate Hart1]